ncbi:indolepyruvate oxidoreductase subunit B [Limnohabitans sp. 2KL-17]|nr:indolepyruvate oxidoreductase subunit B [Limnohabitans sp. 2KL-17]
MTTTSTTTQTRAITITIAILAMGGEGGGVLADWLVDLAEHNGFLAQTTSVPGVAQRTGATIYYLEMFDKASIPDARQPVFALSPFPGHVDIVLASELMEAGRALQRGLVNPERTTLITSSHRVYAMTERIAMGDGRMDSAKLMAGAQAAAHQFIAADFSAIASQSGSLIGPALYGALAASCQLPFTRQQFEDTIRRGGIGVASSLQAFAAGHQAAQQQLLPHNAAAATPVHEPAAPQLPQLPAVGPRLHAMAQRIQQDFRPAAQANLMAGIARLTDYQSEKYATLYLDRLTLLNQKAEASALGDEIVAEAARHLALWMSYEDTVRVADLKIRRSRFDRVRGEVKKSSEQLLDINEFLHPRLEEIADTLPAPVGRWLLKTNWARKLLGRFTQQGRIVKTTSLRGYLLLYAIAELRATRPYSLRYSHEQERISDWLNTVENLLQANNSLALQVVKAQQLVKGYGETHSRGWRNFQRLMSALPKLQNDADAAGQLRKLQTIALSDDSEQELLTSLKAQGLLQHN